MFTDMDESFADFKIRCPEAAARIEKSVKEEQEQELIQEAKRLGKKELSIKELYTFQKKQLDKAILAEQEYEVKKKLDSWPKEIKDVLLDAVIGASILKAPAQIDNLIELYWKCHPAEPIGQSEKQESSNKELCQAEIDAAFDEALR